MRIMVRSAAGLILCPALALAQLVPNLGGQRAGIASLQFLKIGVSARSMGMGEASAVAVTDASALQSNPAAIVQFGRNTAMASHGLWLADLQHSFAAITYSLSSGDALGVSVTSLRTDDLPVTTETQPSGTGEYFRFSDLAVGMTYARRMTDQFSFGATARYVRENLASLVLQTVVFDLGTYYRTGLGSTRLGVVVSNFGGDVAPSGTATLYDGSTVSQFQSFSPPTVFKVGVAFEALQDDQHRLTTSIQLNHPNDNAESVRMGLEYSFREWMFIRAGVKRTIGEPLFGADAKSADDLSAGVGLRIPLGLTEAWFDYGFTHFDQLGLVHRVTLAVEY